MDMQSFRDIILLNLLDSRLLLSLSPPKTTDIIPYKSDMDVDVNPTIAHHHPKSLKKYLQDSKKSCTFAHDSYVGGSMFMRKVFRNGFFS